MDMTTLVVTVLAIGAIGAVVSGLQLRKIRRDAAERALCGGECTDEQKAQIRAVPLDRYRRYMDSLSSGDAENQNRLDW